jgi:hypothetical protein
MPDILGEACCCSFIPLKRKGNFRRIYYGATCPSRASAADPAAVKRHLGPWRNDSAYSSIQVSALRPPPFPLRGISIAFYFIRQAAKACSVKTDTGKNRGRSLPKPNSQKIQHLHLQHVTTSQTREKRPSIPYDHGIEQHHTV